MISDQQIADLRDCFSYDPETGAVSRIKSAAPNAKLGPITTITPAGYLSLILKRVNYSVHRVAWLLSFGMWPAGEIDHINGVKTDNRLSNLREATRSQNEWNSPMRKANTSGYKGVGATKGGRWQARIKQFDKYTYLGTFDTAEEAHQAYCAEAKKRFGQYANDGHFPLQQREKCS